MKIIFKLFLTLFLIYTVNSVNGQCDFPDGDFEVWNDVTSAFNDELSDGTILLPENANPLIRLFSYIVIEGFLEGIFDMISDPALYNRAIFGLERVEDASSGQYALKMGGDSIARTSDLIIIADCGESPDSLFFDAKHFSNTTDSISVFCFIGNSSALPINSDGTLAEANVNKFLAVNFTAFGTSTSFQTLAIDFDVVNPNVPADTIVFWIILDNQNPADGEEYGCIIVDNFRFRREQNSTPTREIFIADHARVFPNLASDFVNIESPDDRIKEIQVFDLTGRLVHSVPSVNAENHQINISNFPNGQYIIRIATDVGYTTQRFFKNH